MYVWYGGGGGGFLLYRNISIIWVTCEAVALETHCGESFILCQRQQLVVLALVLLNGSLIHNVPVLEKT